MPAAPFPDFALVVSEEIGQRVGRCGRDYFGIDGLAESGPPGKRRVSGKAGGWENGKGHGVLRSSRPMRFTPTPDMENVLAALLASRRPQYGTSRFIFQIKLSSSPRAKRTSQVAAGRTFTCQPYHKPAGKGFDPARPAPDRSPMCQHASAHDSSLARWNQRQGGRVVNRKPVIINFDDNSRLGLVLKRISTEFSSSLKWTTPKGPVWSGLVVMSDTLSRFAQGRRQSWPAGR